MSDIKILLALILAVSALNGVFMVWLLGRIANALENGRGGEQKKP